MYFYSNILYILQTITYLYNFSITECFIERSPLGDPVMRYWSMFIFPLRKLRPSGLHKHHECAQIVIAWEQSKYFRHIMNILPNSALDQEQIMEQIIDQNTRF